VKFWIVTCGEVTRTVAVQGPHAPTMLVTAEPLRASIWTTLLTTMCSLYTPGSTMMRPTMSIALMAAWIVV
jgi:hypothetical protein